MELSSKETAAARRRESVPARLLAHRPRPRRLLDFGCGLGRDLEYYQSLGLEAEGHDPFYRPLDLEASRASFDLIACTYVLNTLPPEPRRLVMLQIRRLLVPGGRLLLSVRDAGEVERERRPAWRAEADGWRTHRGTFQKGFDVEETLRFLAEHGFERPLLLRQHHGITVEAVWRGGEA